MKVVLKDGSVLDVQPNHVPVGHAICEIRLTASDFAVDELWPWLRQLQSRLIDEEPQSSVLAQIVDPFIVVANRVQSEVPRHLQEAAFAAIVQARYGLQP